MEVKLQGSEIWKGEEFKELGSIVQSSGDHGKEAKKHVSAGGGKVAKSVSKKDIKGVEDGGETKDPVRLKDRDTEKKTGGRVGGGRSEDAEVVFGRNQDGEDLE